MPDHAAAVALPYPAVWRGAEVTAAGCAGRAKAVHPELLADWSAERYAALRKRVWEVMSCWWEVMGNGSLVLVWRDKTASGNLRIETLGLPSKTIIDADGVLLVKRE
jgi:CRISPR-associated endoribonuclease Cas2 subtype I-E